MEDIRNTESANHGLLLLRENIEVAEHIPEAETSRRASLCHACRLLREPQGNKRPCGLMDKALVFGTKDFWFESCQGHAARNARIATPDHVGRLDPLAVAVAMQWTLHGMLVMLVGSRDEAMLSAWRV